MMAVTINKPLRLTAINVGKYLGLFYKIQ